MTEVFLYNIPDVSEDGFYKLLELVSLDRRTKVLRLQVKEKQIQSLVAWVLLSQVLCNRLKLENDSLRFAQSDNGKPYLLNCDGVYFNIAHTEGMVAVALSDKEIGIDVEKIRTRCPSLCERYFTEAEQRYVLSDEKLCAERFFEVWTRKEAFAKRSGEGLAKTLKDDRALKDETIKTFVADGFSVSVGFDGGEMKIYDTDYCEKLLTPIATGVGLW